MNALGPRRLALILLAAVLASWWPVCACPAGRDVAGCSRIATHAASDAEGGCCGPARAAQAPHGSSAPRGHAPQACRCHGIELIRDGQPVACRGLSLTAALPTSPVACSALPVTAPSVLSRELSLRACPPPPTPVARHTLLLI